jgi:hypothetical protein
VPIAAVQRFVKGASGASVSIGAGDGWATATAGNLLVISANSDALVTLNAPTGVTAGPSVVDGNGTYTWYKIAAGTETAITASPSVSDDITLTVCEYSGAALPIDGSNSSTNAGSPGGTSTTSTSVTATAAADLVIAFALIHTRNTASIATGPSWTNSFVNVMDGNSGGGSVTLCQTFVGELLPAGAAGSVSTVCSWTNGYSDRQQVILAFTAAAAAAELPILVMAPRR